MIKKLNPIHAASLAFLLATGCAQPSGLLVKPAGQVATQGATLHLKLDLGRSTQALVSDVQSIAVTVEVPGRAPVDQTFSQAQWTSDALDFSGLPSGNAQVIVRAFGEQGQLGEGKTLVPLLIGRRTYAEVHVGLRSEGRSDILPFGPLKPATVSVEPGDGTGEATASPSPEPVPGPKPGEFFVPGPNVTSRTYYQYETIEDPDGVKKWSDATIVEQISPSEGGIHVVRSADLNFGEGGTAHHDGTEDYRVNTDGSVSLTMENQTTGEYRSMFFPVGALTPEGVELGPDGRMWLVGTEPHYAAGQVFDCFVVRETRGPAERLSETTYYLAKGYGVVRVDGTHWIDRGDRFDKRTFYMDLTAFQISGTPTNPYAWRVGR